MGEPGRPGDGGSTTATFRLELVPADGDELEAARASGVPPLHAWQVIAAESRLPLPA